MSTSRSTAQIPDDEATGRLIGPDGGDVLDVLGPTIRFVAAPEAGSDAPCVIRGTIPPGGAVPLHSHADPETFIAVSGTVEGLVRSGDAFEWVTVRPGDVFHVPGGARHAWRNDSGAPAVSIIVTTARMGRFFQEIGTPLRPGDAPADPPSEAAVRRLLETSDRYGHWNATPEENAAIGLAPPGT